MAELVQNTQRHQITVKLANRTLLELEEACRALRNLGARDGYQVITWVQQPELTVANEEEKS